MAISSVNWQTYGTSWIRSYGTLEFRPERQTTLEDVRLNIIHLVKLLSEASPTSLVKIRIAQPDHQRMLSHAIELRDLRRTMAEARKSFQVFRQDIARGELWVNGYGHVMEIKFGR